MTCVVVIVALSAMQFDTDIYMATFFASYLEILGTCYVLIFLAIITALWHQVLANFRLYKITTKLTDVQDGRHFHKMQCTTLVFGGSFYSFILEFFSTCTALLAKFTYRKKIFINFFGSENIFFFPIEPHLTQPRLIGPGIH